MAQMADKKDNKYAKIDPRFEWAEGEGFNTLVVHVPGFKSGELKVGFDNISGSLKVTGKHNIEGNKWLQFEKNFPLPKVCDINDIKAKFDNGGLYVVVPKFPALYPCQFSYKPLDVYVDRVVSTRTVVILNVVIAAILSALLVLFRCS